MKSLQVEWIDGWTEREQRGEGGRDEGRLPLQLPVIVSFLAAAKRAAKSKMLGVLKWSGSWQYNECCAHCTVECRKEVQWVGRDFDLHVHKKLMCVNVCECVLEECR